MYSLGLIPARARNTPEQRPDGTGRSLHPRQREGHTASEIPVHFRSDSSPHARGTPYPECLSPLLASRLIPAHAGNTGYQMLYYEALRLIPARARNTLHHNYMLLKNFLSHYSRYHALCYAATQRMDVTLILSVESIVHAHVVHHRRQRPWRAAAGVGRIPLALSTPHPRRRCASWCPRPRTRAWLSPPRGQHPIVAIPCERL